MIALESFDKSLQLVHPAGGHLLQPEIQCVDLSPAEHLNKFLRERVAHPYVAADLTQLRQRGSFCKSSGRLSSSHAARRAERGIPSGVGGQ